MILYYYLHHKRTVGLCGFWTSGVNTSQWELDRDGLIDGRIPAFAGRQAPLNDAPTPLINMEFITESP